MTGEIDEDPLTCGVDAVTAMPWMERGAVGVFPRGESGKDQLAALSQAAAYEIEALPSVVDTKATILRVRIR